MTATAQENKQPAFLNLHEHDGHISLWINRTLLPSMSTALQKHQHPSLLDFSTACTQIYRRETDSCKNDHCSIKTQTTDAIVLTNTDAGIDELLQSVESIPRSAIPGASVTFHKSILEAASGALMGSKNRAIGKIGLSIREILRR